MTPAYKSALGIAGHIPEHIKAMRVLSIPHRVDIARLTGNVPNIKTTDLLPWLRAIPAISTKI